MPIFKTFITGAKFHPGAIAIIKTLKADESVQLILQPDNQYDEHAVMVHSQEDKMLGYIPKDISELVTDLIKHNLSTSEARIVTSGHSAITIAYAFNSILP